MTNSGFHYYSEIICSWRIGHNLSEKAKTLTAFLRAISWSYTESHTESIHFFFFIFLTLYKGKKLKTRRDVRHRKERVENNE